MIQTRLWQPSMVFLVFSPFRAKGIGRCHLYDHLVAVHPVVDRANSSIISSCIWLIVMSYVCWLWLLLIGEGVAFGVAHYWTSYPVS